MVGIKPLTIGYTKDIELAESRPSDWRAPAFHPDLSGRPFAELERGASKMVRPALVAGREDGIYNSGHGCNGGQGSAEGEKILE